jgi:predicted TIM-barrel fold metal-dependent hydrolase
MAMPTDIGIIDTMIGFPVSMFDEYEFIRRQLKDTQSRDEYDFPVEYMFKGVPKELYAASDDPIDLTLREMDRFGVVQGLVGIHDEVGREAVKRHPDRFLPLIGVEPHDGVEGLRRMDRLHEEYGVRAFMAFPSGFRPQVPIDDPKMYPIYARCVELDVPIFVCAGVPGPRFPMAAQHVERIDQVMYDFPELVFVTRHGCEPWEDLAVKLMLKWPNLYYSTSAFAPKHYPKAIIDYANTRGADKVLYAGYFPMGMSLERIMRDLRDVPLRDDVWPKFLRDNARRVLKLDER